MDTSPEQKLLDLIKKGQSKSKLKKDLKIFTKINIILSLVIVAIVAIFLLDVFIFKDKTTEVSQEPQVEEKQVLPIATEAEETEDDIYKNKEPLKNIASVEEIKANLNLLGIVTGENNQAIIEDKNLKKTFFLYKGDNIGEFKVYDIKNNAVILDYKGEKIELNI